MPSVHKSLRFTVFDTLVDRANIGNLILRVLLLLRVLSITGVARTAFVFFRLLHDSVCGFRSYAQVSD